MTEPDNFTIVFFLLVNTVFVILLFTVFSANHKFKPWFLNTFILAKALQLFSFAGFLLNAKIYGFSSNIVPYVFLFVGCGLESFTFISFDGRLRKKTLRIYVISTLFFCITFLLLYNQPSYIRILVSTIAVVFYFSYLGFYLLFHEKKTIIRYLIGCFVLVFSIVHVLRAVYVLFEKESYSFLSSKAFIDILTFIISNLLITMGSIGFLLLLKEEDEFRIIQKNKIIEKDNALLKRLNAKKDTFFSIIAHDLKNPINSLTNLGQMLTQNHSDLPKQDREKIINSIYNSSKKTYNLLSNLLLWACSESGRMSIKNQSINLKELLDVNVYFFSEKVKDKKINIVNNIDESFFIYADYEMMNTVIRNLLSNAIKFSADSGEIIISAVKNNDARFVHVSIEDKGMGIPASAIDTLFELDSAYVANDTENKKGTGLGLKLCNEFIKKNGGKIWVKSEENIGSTFTFSVPARQV